MVKKMIHVWITNEKCELIRDVCVGQLQLNEDSKGAAMRIAKQMRNISVPPRDAELIHTYSCDNVPIDIWLLHYEGKSVFWTSQNEIKRLVDTTAFPYLNKVFLSINKPFRTIRKSEPEEEELVYGMTRVQRHRAAYGVLMMIMVIMITGFMISHYHLVMRNSHSNSLEMQEAGISLIGILLYSYDASVPAHYIWGIKFGFAFMLWMGLSMFFYPEKSVPYHWMFKNAEPTEYAIATTKIRGVITVIIAFAMIIFVFVMMRLTVNPNINL